MGTLQYGGERKFEIDSELLAHVRVAVMTKLRRAEPFMLTVPAGDGTGGRMSVWVSPSIPLGFHIITNPTTLDRALIDALMNAVNSVDGLDLAPFMAVVDRRRAAAV